MKKIILDLCGGTGAWSKPYKDNGYKVINVTAPEYDVRVYEPPKNVYGILVAPPCTMFSFARTNAKKPRNLKEGMEVVRACLNIVWKCMEVKQDTKKKTLSVKFWALENPARGFLLKFLGKPAFIFNPYEFGDMYKKETALWGNFKEPTKWITEENGRLYSHKPNDTLIEKARVRIKDMEKFDYMKSEKIHPEKFGELTRTERRAITPEGFARAFYEANK